MMQEEKILNYLSVTIKEMMRAYPKDRSIMEVSRKFSLGINNVPYKIYEETKNYLIKYYDNIMSLIETHDTSYIVVEAEDVGRSPELIPALMGVIKKYINEHPDHKLFERILDMVSIVIA